jgi:hypothetical protein
MSFATESTICTVGADGVRVLSADPARAIPREPRRYAVQRVAARYDAAQTTDENRRHWAWADSLAADAANLPQIRLVLRNRSRYEVANNSYAKGIVLTLANDCVGTGPRLHVTSRWPEANLAIKRGFSQWAAAVGLAAKLRTMRAARAQDGEAFALLVTNPSLPSPVKLDLKLIEAEQVCTTDAALFSIPSVDGIELDELGNPLV